MNLRSCRVSIDLLAAPPAQVGGVAMDSRTPMRASQQLSPKPKMKVTLKRLVESAHCSWRQVSNQTANQRTRNVNLENDIFSKESLKVSSVCSMFVGYLREYSKRKSQKRPRQMEIEDIILGNC